MGKPCQHSPPPVKEGDSPETIIDKTIYAISLHHTTVDWRRSVLAALVVTLLLFFLMQPTIPYGSDFVIVATFLTLAYYLANSWFVWSWSNPVDQQIEKALIVLRKQALKEEAPI